MAKTNKKLVRENFRRVCLERDKHRCVMCEKSTGKLDVHHISDRKIIPEGSVLENGITLCAGEDENNCHWKAEQYHATGVSYPGYSPEELYIKILSSFELAWRASLETAQKLH